MNTMLRQKAKNNFEGFSKNYEIVRKGRNIKLVTTERKRNYLVSEQNHHTTKFFTENVLAVEMKKKNSNINEHTCSSRFINIRSM